jgi:hypothetical protein
MKQCKEGTPVHLGWFMICDSGLLRSDLRSEQREDTHNIFTTEKYNDSPINQEYHSESVKRVISARNHTQEAEQSEYNIVSEF